MNVPSISSSTEATTFQGLVTCRAGLERVLAAELTALRLEVDRIGRRAVFFRSDKAGVYRANMALRSGLAVLLPIRTFNARNYDMLYYQARKTNWHKLFAVDRTVRIDVNGGSDALANTQYVTHRIKDGIVDTFRKLTGGTRPSIDKRDPDIHVVAHLDGKRVTLCFDTSGTPLFKRGYRAAHGLAPIKEDLAAGILQLAGWNGRVPLLDPLCGAGTFLFEGWMLAANIAPNLERRFAFESLFDYEPDLHRAEQAALRAARRDPPETFHITGLEIDGPTRAVAEAIRRQHFSDAPVEIIGADFRSWGGNAEDAFLVANPPYGKRLGNPAEAIGLHRDLAAFVRDRCPGGTAAVFTANTEAAGTLDPRPEATWTLYNGRLEGRLVKFAPGRGGRHAG